LALIALVGCRGNDIHFDCENQALEFNKQSDAKIEPLLTEIPNQGPFPVAIQISGEGLNELLAGVLSEGAPFAGTVPFALTQYGPSDAEFAPTSAPRIILAETPGCKNCVRFHLDFGVQVTAPEMAVSSGFGFVDLLIPVRLDVDAANKTSTLVAEYANARIAPDGEDCSSENKTACGFYLLVYGFESTEHTMVAGALKRFMEEDIAETFEDRELLTIGSWQIGDGAIELLAEKLEIQPENDKIVLGMHTNLPLAPGVGLDTSQPLLPGSVLTVAMDPRIMLPMAYRMLDEGHIARVYNEDGEPDPDGIYGLTLEDIAPTEGGAQSFDCTFRVWRTDEGYCGNAKAVMPLAIVKHPPALGIEFMAGDAELLEGQGFGAAALKEDELVDQNQGLIDRFRKDLSEQMKDTVNFSAIDLADSDIVFSMQDTELTATALTTYLDFVVVAEE
jgi:hypothetical protein